MHDMLGEVLDLDGLESPCPHIEGEVKGLMAAGLELGQQFGREVQAGRRRGHRARG